MKRVVFSLLAAAAITFSANAQVTKGNPQHHKEGRQFHHGRHMHGPIVKNLNLTDAQKQQLKADNEEFRNKLKALKKQ